VTVDTKSFDLLVRPPVARKEYPPGMFFQIHVQLSLLIGELVR
jgi:hypothetical protein